MAITKILSTPKVAKYQSKCTICLFEIDNIEADSSEDLSNECPNCEAHNNNLEINIEEQ